MLRKAGLAALLVFTLAGLPAAAHEGAPPVSAGHALMPVTNVMVLELEPIVPAVLLAQDKTRTKPGPLRFAVPEDVNATPDTHGTWEDLPDGGRVWRLRVSAPGATDLNFGFTRYELPPGATLHVISVEHDYYQGPYTAAHNRDHGQLWTPVVPGSDAVIELFVTPEPAFAPVLELGRVGRGYRNLFATSRDLDKQGSCNNDVICPEGDPWRDEIRSVGNVGFGASLFCTGTLVMDVPQDFRPYLLTANHCGIDAGNAASTVVYWNYESPTCGQLGGGTLSDNTSGATFRAADTGNDLCLLELDSQPDPAYDAHWAGWDARGSTAPAGSVGIHHPDNDEKAISFNTDPLTTGNSCIGSGGVDTHWYVTEWEDGTTEPGSSGSGLWDPATHLLVGYLSGGIASCANTSGYDCYGKLSVGWGRGLSTWLDPQSTGTLVVPGSDLPTVEHAGHVGIDLCPADPANENGVWEPGETVAVTVSLLASVGLTGVSGTLSSTTPGVSIPTASSPWPNLSADVPAGNSNPFVVSLAEYVPCQTTLELELVVDANEGGPFVIGFTQTVGETVVPSDVPLTIPNPGTDSSFLTIVKDVTLSDVNVHVAIDHTWVGDVSVVLRSPAGTAVTLLDRPGYPNSVYGCGDDDMDVVFDDASGVDLESHCAGTSPWYSGTAAPTTSLSALVGEPSAGTWSLEVTDGASGDAGTLIDWQLLTTPPAGGTCTVCSTPEPPLFADGFESGDTSGWDGAAP